MSWKFTKAWLLPWTLGAYGLLTASPVTAQTGPAPRATLSFATAEAPASVTVASGGQIIAVPVTPAPALPGRVMPVGNVEVPAVRIVNVTSRGQIDAVSPAGAAPAPPSAPPASAFELRPLFPRSPGEPRHRSYSDLTAAPCFGHASDYNWIMGQVEYSSVAKQWRLRYASVDEVDRYGGHVVLIENQFASQLRDGMYVHVRGHVVNPESHGSDPTYYRIDWVRRIDNPNEAPPLADAR